MGSAFGSTSGKCSVIADTTSRRALILILPAIDATDPIR